MLADASATQRHLGDGSRRSGAKPPRGSTRRRCARLGASRWPQRPWEPAPNTTIAPRTPDIAQADPIDPDAAVSFTRDAHWPNYPTSALGTQPLTAISPSHNETNTPRRSITQAKKFWSFAKKHPQGITRVAQRGAGVLHEASFIQTGAVDYATPTPVQ